jgi:AAA family ATP:ADP antiporter
MVFLGIWIWLAFEIRKEHVSYLRASLSERRILPEPALRAAFLDKDSIDKIRAMLADANEEIVLYAIDLAVAIGREDLIPAGLAGHPAPGVRLKAAEILSLTESEFQQRLTEETDPAVQAKILARGCSMAGASKFLDSPALHEHSHDIRLRLACACCQVSSTPAHDIHTARKYLKDAIGKVDDTSEDWVHVAEAIGEIHHPAVVDLHMRLIAHTNRAVRKKAILSAGRAGHRELVPVLVRLLASHETSSVARDALREYKGRILGTLSDIFTDQQEDIEIRRQIPLVLAHIPTQQTVDVLIHALSDEDGLLSFRAIRALNRLRVGGYSLHFDAEAISARIHAECEKALWHEHVLNALYPNPQNQDLLEQLLKEKVHQGRERVFRLLGLMLPPAAAHAAYKAIVEEDSVKKDNAVEYLDNVLSSQLKKWVIPLIEVKKEVFGDRMTAVVEALSRSNDPVIRECTLNAMEKHNWIGTAVAGNVLS